MYGRNEEMGTKIFFWGAINSKGVSDIVFIEGKMDSQLYIEVLKNGLLPMYNRLGLNKNEVTFQDPGISVSRFHAKLESNDFGENRYF